MRILVVDDNRSSADALARALGKQGDQTEAVYDGATAIARINAEPPDLILTDLRMEPVDGMEVLRAARSVRPPVETIVFTAYGAVDTAVEAMRLGARDFLTKPVSLEQVMTRVRALRGDEEPVGPDATTPYTAESPTSRALIDALRQAAGVPTSVWMEGEMGTGRGHAALTLHQLGPETGPLVTLDPARPFEWPTSGTVVLPNVDDLPDDLQRDLTRRLHHVPEGVRIIATASPEARARLSQGVLRQELYFKLAVLVIRVPPLRERRQDIVPIFLDALQRFASRYKRPLPELSTTDALALEAHSWPGNVRELLNVAERAVVMGTAGGLNLVPTAHASSATEFTFPPGFCLNDYLDDLEKSLLAQAKRMCNFDRNAMSELLGVERNTLRYKLTKYDLM